MASASIPLTNVGSGYTIVTQVLPSSTAPTTAGQNSCQTLSPLQKFLKGEPKALGTVQIMNGFLMLFIGFATIQFPISYFVLHGFVFWGSLFHILSGILTVSASNKFKLCMIKAALVMNILSAISAALCIITVSVDLMFARSHYYYYGCSSCLKGINGVLLVFSLLQFAVSISISAFGCKVTCSKDPPLNIINVVPNPEGYVPVGSSFPAHHTQPGIRTINAVAMNSLPEERPPAYSELKSESDN